jgi:RNA polymerase sigma-70 factor (ECF subfamily)
MSGALEHDDARLLRLAAGGDREAFEVFYRRRQQGVHRFALNMSGSPATADEVTQEVFMALVREPHIYDPGRGSIAALLYGIARNHVLRIQKKERRFAALPDCDGDEVSPDVAVASDPEIELIRSAEINVVRQAILALAPVHREVVALCELEEMSYAEAADILGCAVGTVRSRLHRARQMLRQDLNLRRQARPDKRNVPRES